MVLATASEAGKLTQEILVCLYDFILRRHLGHEGGQLHVGLLRERVQHWGHAREQVADRRHGVRAALACTHATMPTLLSVTCTGPWMTNAGVVQQSARRRCCVLMLLAL